MCEPSIVLSARCILYLGSDDPDVFSSELSARLKLHDGAGTVRLRAFRWSFNLATVSPCENLSLSSSYFRAYSFAPLNHIRPHKNIASESFRIKLPSYALFVYLSFSISHYIPFSSRRLIILALSALPVLRDFYYKTNPGLFGSQNKRDWISADKWLSTEVNPNPHRPNPHRPNPHPSPWS